MHSFHHSRGRILFEAFCALTISASCVGAWMDLGTLAFLPAAAVTALYGLVHLFDLRGRKPAVAFAAPAVELEAESEDDLLAYADAPEPVPAVEPAQSFVELVEEAAPVEVAEPVAVSEPAAEPEPVRESRSRKRKSAKKAEPVANAGPVPEPAVEPEAVVDADPAENADPIEAEIAFGETEPTELEAFDEPEEHAPVTPLFEPEPFVRQQRAVFGRKAG